VKEPVRRLEFHILYQCTNSCVFCCESEHMRNFGAYPALPEDVSAILKAKRRQGYDHVTFTGGEPTLYPGLLDALRQAKHLGYKTFLISNGAALSIPEFCARILPFTDELCFSVHGHNAALHDKLARNPRAFVRIKKALENVRSHPRRLFVMINTVVNRLNVGHLPALLRWAGRFDKVRHFLLSHMAPEGDGLRRFKNLAVRHKDIAKQLPAMAAAAKAKGITLRVFGVPACELGEHWKLSNDLYFSPRVTVARAFLKGGKVGWFEEPSLDATRARRHLPFCSRCGLHEKCGGVFRRYYREFGKEGMHPLA